MDEQQEIKYAQTIRNQRVDMFRKVTRGLEDLDLTNTETRKYFLSFTEQTEKTAMWVFEVEAFLNGNISNLAFTSQQPRVTKIEPIIMFPQQPQMIPVVPMPSAYGNGTQNFLPAAPPNFSQPPPPPMYIPPPPPRPQFPQQQMPPVFPQGPPQYQQPNMSFVPNGFQMNQIPATNFQPPLQTFVPPYQPFHPPNQTQTGVAFPTAPIYRPPVRNSAQPTVTRHLAENGYDMKKEVIAKLEQLAVKPTQMDQRAEQRPAAEQGQGFENPQPGPSNQQVNIPDMTPPSSASGAEESAVMSVAASSSIEVEPETTTNLKSTSNDTPNSSTKEQVANDDSGTTGNQAITTAEGSKSINVSNTDKVSRENYNREDGKPSTSTANNREETGKKWVKREDSWKVASKKTWRRNDTDNSYHHRDPPKSYVFSRSYNENPEYVKLGETSNSHVASSRVVPMEENKVAIDLPETEDIVEDPSIPSTSSSSSRSAPSKWSKKKAVPKKPVKNQKSKKELDEEEDKLLNEMIAENERIKAEKAAEQAELQLKKQKEEEDLRKKLVENREMERHRQQKLKQESDAEERRKYAEMQKMREAFLRGKDEGEEKEERDEVFTFDFKGSQAASAHCTRVLNGMQTYVKKLIADENKDFTEEEIANFPKFRRLTMQANICATGTPTEVSILKEFMQEREETHSESSVPGDSLRHVLYVALSQNFHPCLYTSILHLLTADDGTKGLQLLESDFIRMLLEMPCED